MKILVVDDSESIRELIKNTLRTEGIEVETAGNGADALTKFVTFKPDLVTLDLVMPIMDGFETLTRLRKLDSNSKILMLTVLDNWVTIERCIEKGAIGVLPKPFGIDQLINTIKNPWNYKDGNFIILFSIITNRIQDALTQIMGSDTTLSLKNIEIIRALEITTPQISVGLRDVHLNMTERLTNFIIPVGEHTKGYVSTFNGHQNGKIISFISESEVEYLTCSTSDYFVNNSNHVCDEIFNSINGKIFTVFMDYTNLRLSCEPVRPYNETIDKTALPNWEAIKGTFEISIRNSKISFETQIWGNIKQMQGRRF